MCDSAALELLSLGKRLFLNFLLDVQFILEEDGGYLSSSLPSSESLQGAVWQFWNSLTGSIH